MKVKMGMGGILCKKEEDGRRLGRGKGENRRRREQHKSFPLHLLL